jgi:ribosomal protein L32
MNFCPNCGAQRVGAGAFCATCGNQLGLATPVAPLNDQYGFPVSVPPIAPAAVPEGSSGGPWPEVAPISGHGIPEVVMGPDFDASRDCMNCGSTLGAETVCRLCGAEKLG